MIRSPFLIKNFISGDLLTSFQKHADELKRIGPTLPEDKLFKRIGFHNDSMFTKFHREFVAPMAMKLYKMPLKPSYNFLSCYHQGEGECPLHVDRHQCFVTIDICLNQLKPWPLYINSSENFDKKGVDLFFTRELAAIEQIRENSEEFIMEPGDAVCYSGTTHAHWRKQIDADNFCDLVFFHFVEENFEGDLG